MELWQRFTHRARRAILIAHDEGTRVRQEQIGTEHLLLGILQLEEGAGFELLGRIGVDRESLFSELRSKLEAGSAQEGNKEIAFTPSAQRALQLAYSASRDRKDPHINTGHLLLGIVREPRGLAHSVLGEHGVDSAKVEAALDEVAAEEAGVGIEGMTRETLGSDRIPPAVGPYSQAVRAGGFIFCSGVIGLSPKTGELVIGEFEDEVRQVLDNLRILLEDCGSGLGGVVKTTVFLTDMAQFSAFNAIYAEYFPQDPPARSTVQAAALPKGARIEVEAIVLAD